MIDKRKISSPRLFECGIILALKKPAAAQAHLLVRHYAMVLYNAACVGVKFRTILKQAGTDVSNKTEFIEVRVTCR
jgi:hypothetical protein